MFTFVWCITEGSHLNWVVNEPSLPWSNVSQHPGTLSLSARTELDVTAKIVHACIMGDQNQGDIAHTGKEKESHIVKT